MIPIVLQKMDQTIKGVYFTKINQALIKQMHENWIPNDIFWPTVLLDNMPNFQIGILEVVRYNVRVLRDNLSRMRTTDKLDPYAEKAFTLLSNDPHKWWFPSAESKWELGYEKLDLFAQNLITGKSHFYPRADNLIQLLEQYVSLMGGVNTRLINAPRDLPDDGTAIRGGRRQWGAATTGGCVDSQRVVRRRGAGHAQARANLAQSRPVAASSPAAIGQTVSRWRGLNGSTPRSK